MRQQTFCIVVLSVSCLAAFPASAQQDKPAPPDKGQPAQKSSSTRSKEEHSLAEATRASTAEAARKAAEAVTQPHGSDSASQASGAPDVLEFHATGPGAQDSGGAATTKESKKSALKSVHGDAYGALDSHGAAKQTGGAAGATSKSGKASIYVETNRSHDTTTAPH